MDGAIDCGVLCFNCAQHFTPKRSDNVFCSKKCGMAHWKLMHPDSWHRYHKPKTDTRKSKKYMRGQERAAVRTLYEKSKNAPCKDCGVKYDPVCMDFDHRNPREKYRELSKLHKEVTTVARLQEEIDKCDLVCSNCHRLRTKRRHHGSG